jgi:hypothetical protein
VDCSIIRQSLNSNTNAIGNGSTLLAK